MFLSSGTATLATASLLVTHMPRFLGQTLGLLQRWLSLQECKEALAMSRGSDVCLEKMAAQLKSALRSPNSGQLRRQPCI